MRENKIYPKLAFIAILIILIYYQTFVWLYERFSDQDSYYSHGFLVPLVVGFIIWQKRKKLKAIDFKPSALGFMLLFSGLVLQMIGIILEAYLISVFSLLMIIFGITFYLFGRKVGKELLFPLSFLFFMVPIPMFIINYISFPMRQFVTRAVVFTLDKFGLPVIQRGFEIIFPNALLAVDTPCSGLRSLITFLALGSLFAYFLNASTKKRIALFLMAFPIAIVSNYLRVILLSLISFIYGAKVATEGFIHNLSGITVFSAGFILLIIVRGILNERI